MPFTWLQEFVTVILMGERCKKTTTLSNAIYLVNALSTMNILQLCDCTHWQALGKQGVWM